MPGALLWNGGRSRLTPAAGRAAQDLSAPRVVDELLPFRASLLCALVLLLGHADAGDSGVCAGDKAMESRRCGALCSVKAQPGPLYVPAGRSPI